ncbi:tyrosine-type recombinase/integrase [Weizmannia acidilactici]|uniref:tyrosine-type recombinase/integrase n=1 Tax=Weizmannia acidilactici TaxID=2607726 RepID=UPI00124CF6DA|nr:site-specific integrase [Weizmannia acidilactici]GER73382.1 hypothetical protein BpPP18_14490 [Weizmannia acidilactici]
MSHWRKRGDNSFLLVLELGRDAKGKKIRKHKTIRIEDPKLLRTTKRLNDYLNEQLVIFKTQVEAGEYIKPQKMYFKNFAEDWYEKYVVPELGITTAKKYRSHLDNHIIPFFGEMNFEQIKPIDIVNFKNHLRDPSARKDGKKIPLSDRTIADIYAVLESLFSKAVAWKVIEESPLASEERPKFEQKEMKFYEGNEIIQVISAMYNELSDMWRLFFLGAIIGGLRRGELIGLEWSAVDFVHNGLEVRQNIPMTKNRDPVIKGTKNNKKRFVPMPDWYMEELAKYKMTWDHEKDKLGDAWKGGEHEFVFHGGVGKPLYHTSPTTQWRRFAKNREDFKYVRLHDLRHTMVTYLLESHVSPKLIQKRAGHSSEKVTNDIYGHVTSKMNKEGVIQFEKLNPKKFGQQMGDNKKNG